MATLSELLTRALQVYNEQVENMNSNVRIGSLLRDIVNYLDTKQDKETGKGLSTNDFSATDKTNLTTIVNLLNDNPDNVLDTISEVFKILESYPEGVKVVDLLDGKLDKGTFTGSADDLNAGLTLLKRNGLLVTLVSTIQSTYISSNFNQTSNSNWVTKIYKLYGSGVSFHGKSRGIQVMTIGLFSSSTISSTT